MMLFVKKAKRTISLRKGKKNLILYNAKKQASQPASFFLLINNKVCYKPALFQVHPLTSTLVPVL